jgi:hypothetical protein
VRAGAAAFGVVAVTGVAAGVAAAGFDGAGSGAAGWVAATSGLGGVVLAHPPLRSNSRTPASLRNQTRPIKIVFMR